jgi:hypothetical protein
LTSLPLVLSVSRRFGRASSHTLAFAPLLCRRGSFSSMFFFVLSHFWVLLSDGSFKTRIAKQSCRRFFQNNRQKNPNRFVSILFYHVLGRFLVSTKKSDCGPFLAFYPPTQHGVHWKKKWGCPWSEQKQGLLLKEKTASRRKGETPGFNPKANNRCCGDK